MLAFYWICFVQTNEFARSEQTSQTFVDVKNEILAGKLEIDPSPSSSSSAPSSSSQTEKAIIIIIIKNELI